MVRLASPSFALITDCDPETAKPLLRELEVFRQTVSRYLGLPGEHRMQVNVYLWASTDVYEQFRPAAMSRRRPLGGYHTSDGFTHALVVQCEPGLLATRATLFHEYTHLLTSRVFRRVPLWIHEGLAELFETFEVGGSQFSFGGPTEHRMKTLAAEGPLHTRDLIEVHDDSAAYQAADQVPRFYASAWLLMHVSAVSKARFNAPAVRDYILQSGMTTNRSLAFQRAFGRSPEQADERARDLLRTRAFEPVTGRFEGANITASAQQWLLPAEISLQQGILARMIGLEASAESLLREAHRAMPWDPRPAEQLGFLLNKRGRPEEALELLRWALDHGSASCRTYYVAAGLRWNRLAGGSLAGASAAGERGEVRRLIERAVQLDPWQAECHGLLAFVLLHVEPGNPHAAELAARRALHLDPYLYSARLTLAEALAAGGQRADARRATSALLTSPITPDLRRRVEELALRLGIGATSR